MKMNGLYAKKDIISATSTAVIWLLLLVLSLAVKPGQEIHYDTIQLIFEEEEIPEVIPEPVPVQKVIEQPKPQEIKEVSAEKKESPAPAPAKQPAPVQNTPNKTQSSAVPAAPAQKMAEQKLVQSMDDLIAQNAKQVKKEAVWDESLFESSAREQQSQDQPVPKINSTEPVQELSGTAASSQQDTAAVSDVQTSRTPVSSDSVMSNTERALQNISSAKPGTYTAQGKDQGISFETQSSSRSEGDGIAMDLADGTSRRLIYPSKPVIVLSAESEKLITSSRTLTIVFTVLANGTVSPGNISFQPAGILPISVQSEIRAQIGQWRFEEEKSDGQARLTYSINVK